MRGCKIEREVQVRVETALVCACVLAIHANDTESHNKTMAKTSLSLVELPPALLKENAFSFIRIAHVTFCVCLCVFYAFSPAAKALAIHENLTWTCHCLPCAHMPPCFTNSMVMYCQSRISLPCVHMHTKQLCLFVFSRLCSDVVVRVP
jgi:hypothetical protein